MTKNKGREYYVVLRLEVEMRSYKEQKIKVEEVEQNNQEGVSAEELARKLARAYNGKSNMAMMKNILEEAERSKRAGTLSDEEIEVFYQSFAPMLSPPQRKQLRAIVERLKDI